MPVALSREEYRRNLDKFPISNPTLKHVRNIFPHLDEDAINKFISPHDRSITRTIALPPTMIDGAYWTVWHHYQKKERKDNVFYVPIIEFDEIVRTDTSYQKQQLEGNIHGTAYHDEAIEYARKHWGKELILDSWLDFVELNLRDPNQRNRNHWPNEITSVYFGTNRRWTDILNDISKPLSEIIDDAIEKMTTDKKAAEEMQGGRTYKSRFKSYCHYNCALDGGGLNDKCRVCNKKTDFKADGTWNTPIPSRLSNFLRKEGFIFKKDPISARALEAKEFLKNKP